MIQVFLFKRHVKGTAIKAIVNYQEALLCNLTKAVQDGVKLPTRRVYINTRVIKHLFDTRPPVEFELVIKNLLTVVKYPDEIYSNKNGKRGSYCFVKNVNDQKYFCSIELIRSTNVMIIVTSFLIRNDRYLKSYTLLWSWRGGGLSS